MICIPKPANYEFRWICYWAVFVDTEDAIQPPKVLAILMIPVIEIGYLNNMGIVGELEFLYKMLHVGVVVAIVEPRDTYTDIV